MSRSLNMTLTDTWAPPSREIWATALSTAYPLLPNTRCAARCSVVTKDVEETTTPAGTDREGQGHSKASGEHPERLQIYPGHAMHWHCGEWDCCEGATLRPNSRPFVRVGSGEHMVCGRNPSARASHGGISTPTSRKRVADSSTVDRQTDPFSIQQMMSCATMGCLTRTISRQSAQLPQWAASQMRQEPPTPKPPKVRGSDNDEMAFCCKWSRLTWRILAKHSTTFLSCCLANSSWNSGQQKICTCNRAETEQKPTGLNVLFLGNPVQQLRVFQHFLVQLRKNEMIVTHGDTQHLQSLLRPWQFRVPSPHNCFRDLLRTTALMCPPLPVCTLPNSRVWSPW